MRLQCACSALAVRLQCACSALESRMLQSAGRCSMLYLLACGVYTNHVSFAAAQALLACCVYTNYVRLFRCCSSSVQEKRVGFTIQTGKAQKKMK